MTKAQITTHHRDLERLVGQWEGPELVRESPDAKPIEARARVDIRTGLQGFFVMLERQPPGGLRVRVSIAR